jgi:hypothetical protein
VLRRAHYYHYQSFDCPITIKLRDRGVDAPKPGVD